MAKSFLIVAALVAVAVLANSASADPHATPKKPLVGKKAFLFRRFAAANLVTSSPNVTNATNATSASDTSTVSATYIMTLGGVNPAYYHNSTSSFYYSTSAYRTAAEADLVSFLGTSSIAFTWNPTYIRFQYNYILGTYVYYWTVQFCITSLSGLDVHATAVKLAGLQTLPWLNAFKHGYQGGGGSVLSAGIAPPPTPAPPTLAPVLLHGYVRFFGLIPLYFQYGHPAYSSSTFYKSLVEADFAVALNISVSYVEAVNPYFSTYTVAGGDRYEMYTTIMVRSDAGLSGFELRARFDAAALNTNWVNATKQGFGGDKNVTVSFMSLNGGSTPLTPAPIVGLLPAVLMTSSFTIYGYYAHYFPPQFNLTGNATYLNSTDAYKALFATDIASVLNVTAADINVTYVSVFRYNSGSPTTYISVYFSVLGTAGEQPWELASRWDTRRNTAWMVAVRQGFATSGGNTFVHMSFASNAIVAAYSPPVVLVTDVRVGGNFTSRYYSANPGIGQLIRVDLARLLGVDIRHVSLDTYTTQGYYQVWSYVYEHTYRFNVSASVGVQSSALVAILNGAGSGSWLTTTRSAFYPSEHLNISLLGVPSINATGAPDPAATPTTTAMTTAVPTTTVATVSGTSTPNMTVRPTVTTPAPNGDTLPPGVVAAVTARIRIAGSDFRALLEGNATALAQLATAVASDLGTLLGIDAIYVIITNMYVGSLVVEFSVSSAAGVQPSILSSRLSNATTSNAWLSSTQSVYSTVSNETLAVTEVPQTLSSAPPGAVTPAPPSPPATAAPTANPIVSGASSLFSVAAFVAAAVSAVMAAAL